MYCTLYRRTPGFVQLAEAELSALAGGAPAEPGVWLSPAPIRWAQTGYGMATGRQLAFASCLDELRDQLLVHQLAAPRIGISVRRVPRKAKGAHKAKVVIADCIDGDVDFENPQLRLILVLSRHGYRVLLEGESGNADWLRSSHKPHNYLVALPVRIAKAMINLTAKPDDTVLDAFCGSGTIPLLAAWAGHSAFGSDISAKSVARAKENIAHFGQHVTLRAVDARTATQQADCIVSNLPYGVYCHLEDDALRAVLANFKRLTRRVTLVSSERLEQPLLAQGFTISQMLRVESDRFERFIYVTSNG